MTTKGTIGLTAANKEVVKMLINKGWFEEEKEVGKFAMGLAINKGVESGVVDGVVPLWDIETFDDEGNIKSLISALYPAEKQPYIFAETLINRGLEIIDQHLKSNPEIDISDLWR
jgi:hypothetical protein